MITKNIRTQLKWTQKRLADYLGVDVRTVGRWETYQSTPSPLALEKIIQLQRDFISGKVAPDAPDTAQNQRRGGLLGILDRFHRGG